MIGRILLVLALVCWLVALVLELVGASTGRLNLKTLGTVLFIGSFIF